MSKTIEENPCRCGATSFGSCHLGDGTQKFYCRKCGSIDDPVVGRSYVDLVALWNARIDLRGKDKEIAEMGRVIAKMITQTGELTADTRFKVTLIEDDKYAGYKKGQTFNPKGVYWNKKNIIVVGSRPNDHTIRIKLKADIVKVEVT